MIKKKSFTSAFTLIELLVVITIIGILAGIALPVFNSVQIKGAQTKALAQAKQIGLALKLCASDNDGVYPADGTPTLLKGPKYSNDAFAALIPQYLTNEQVFSNKLVTGSLMADNYIDNPYTGTRVNSLKTQECVYDYMMGLTDSSNSSAPLVFDHCSSSFTYSNVAGAAGAVWGGTKAVVIRLDNSGAVESLNTQIPASAYVKGVDASGQPQNALDPSKGANGLSTTANTVLAAQGLPTT